MDKKTAAILAAIGGAFYIIGGITAALFIASLYGFVSGLSGSQSLANEGANNANFLLAFGFIVGILMIVAGIGINSNNKNVRIASSIIVIILALLGAINTLGGDIVGIVLAMIGGIGGLLFKS